MIVKNDDDDKQGMLVGSIIMFFFSVYTLLQEEVLAFVAALMAGILCLLCTLILYRELIFDEYGCTLKIYKYERTYSWHELKVKKIIRKKNTEWAFFSVGYVNKLPWITPFEYCAFRHPLTCFYVTLMPEGYEIPKRPLSSIIAGALARGVTKNNYTHPDSMYDKAEFLRQLEEWGIELEDDEK